MRHFIQPVYLKQIGMTLAIAASIPAAIVGVVILTGGTFGQRCARLHPGASEVALDRCVYDLQHPIEAARAAGYERGYRDGVGAMATVVGMDIDAAAARAAAPPKPDAN